MLDSIQPGNATADVVIIGAGITGVNCAMQLQAAGKNCIVVEAHNYCFGSTGGTTAHLNNFFDATYDQVAKDFGKEDARLLATSGNEALDIIKQNINRYNIDCDFREYPAYLFSLDEKQEQALDSIIEGSLEAGIAMRVAENNPFPIPCTKTVEIPEQAAFHPVKYVTALFQHFIKAGGRLMEGCRVLNVKRAADELVVETTHGEIKCQSAIYATHLPPGKNIMHFRNAPYRSYAMAVKLNNGNYPQALGYDLCEPYHYYRPQEINGVEYLIAGGEDHKTGADDNTAQCFENLEKYIRQYFNIGEVAYKWSSQYYEPADGLPYIGHLPGNPDGVYVATGYNGNGMIFGTIAGKILADLINGKENRYADLFKPSRVKPVAGFSSFVKEGADVVKHFIGDKLAVEKIESLAELEKGEGKVVKYEGSSIAVYRNGEGAMHMLSAACTHLYCNVQWNKAEQSWDCPCHGSRFGIDGHVLTGPAVEGLKPIENSEA